MTDLTTSDQYAGLRDEIEETLAKVSAVSAEFKLRVYHQIGKLVATHDLYQKHDKGSGHLVKQLAADIHISPAMLYDSVKFYESCPDVSQFVEKFPNTTEARRALRGADCDHQHPTETEQVVKVVVRCANCKRKV